MTTTDDVAAHDPALASIIRRVEARVEAVGDEMVERYRAEIVDYAAIEATTLVDVRVISTENLRALLASVVRDEPMEHEELELTRRGAARRVHQGVSLDAVLRAYRLWGSVVWETILACARQDRPAEREAALGMAARVLAHIDLVSVAVAEAYVAEAQGLWSDRELMRRDLLDALLSGTADAPSMQREADSLRLTLHDGYMVVVAKLSRETDEMPPPLTLRALLRHGVEMVKWSLRPSESSLLVGVRQEEVIALYPSDGPASSHRLKEQCEALARDLSGDGFGIGIGGWHPGTAGVAASYADARDAVARALDRGTLDRPVAFDDIVVDHILRSSPVADRVLVDTLAPLLEYDRKRGSALVETLRAYFDAGYQLRGAADALSVHPNTVVYRLRRVRELTGRDPGDPEDLLLLVLGLRLVSRSP